MMRKMFLSLLVLPALLIAGTSFQAAQAQDKPELMSLDVAKNTFTITLNLNSDPMTVDQVLLYEADGDTKDMNDFSMIKTIATNSGNVSIENGNLTATGERNSFFQVGSHSYYVSLMSGGNEGDASNILLNDNPKFENFLTFFINSDPMTDLIMGNEYVYSVQIAEIGNTNPEAEYTLTEAPEGATISPDGDIMWMPEKTGIYSFKLEVKSLDMANTGDHQFWTVKVRKCEDPGSVSLHLTWKDNGEPVTGAYPWLYTMNNGELVKYDIILPQNNGDYKSEIVDAGTYYVFVHDIYSQPTWYPEAGFQYDAQPVEVMCGENKELMMSLEKGQQYYPIFTNYPVTTAKVGEEYTFQCDIDRVNGQETVTKIVEGPYGAVIDNGTLRWTPETPGKYHISLNGWVKGNPYYVARLNWDVNVPACDQKSSITINGLGYNGDPLSKFGIVIVKIDESGNEEIIEYSDASSYTLDGLDAGTYYIAIVDYDSLSIGEKGAPLPTFHYYSNATTMDDATPIMIGCDENKEISISFRDKLAGVSDLQENSGIVVYPNPASENVNISLKETYNIKQVQIYSSAGVLVANYNKPYGSRINIDLGRFASGQYYIRIFTHEGIINKPLSIMK